MPVPIVNATSVWQPRPAPSSSSARANARASLMSADREAHVSLERLDDRVVLPAGEVAEEHGATALEVERPGHGEPDALACPPPPAELARQHGDPVEHDGRPQLGLGRQLPVGHDARRRIVLEHDPLDARSADIHP